MTRTEFAHKVIEITAATLEVDQHLVKRISLKGSRKRAVVEARMIAACKIIRSTKLGLERIGELFNIDHSTLSYYDKHFDWFTETDKYFREKYHKVSEAISINIGEDGFKYREQLQFQRSEKYREFGEEIMWLLNHHHSEADYDKHVVTKLTLIKEINELTKQIETTKF